MTDATTTERTIAGQRRERIEACEGDLRDALAEMAAMHGSEIPDEMLHRWVHKVGGAAVMLGEVLQGDAKALAAEQRGQPSRLPEAT